MATFEIELKTVTGDATVYTDDLAAFVRAMDVQVLGASRSVVGLPKILGYVGPIVTGRIEGGEPVVRYEAVALSEEVQRLRFA